jgi:ribosomal protein S6--L-glutamate ligase
VIIGDPKVDSTGLLYEAAFADRGVVAEWIDLRTILDAITNSDGETLLAAAEASPKILQIKGEEFSLADGTFGISAGTPVIIVNNDFDAYAWVVTHVLHKIRAVQANSARSLREANNKWITHQRFKEAGLPVPEAALVSAKASLESAAEVLGYPLVLKELEGAQGKGVRLARTQEELLSSAQELGFDRRPLMLEHYIEIGGMDLRVVTIAGEFAAAMARHAKDGDFRANLAQGGRAESYDVSADQLELVRRASAAEELNFVGMDIGVVQEVLPGREYLPLGSSFLIEANPMSGLKGLLDATGFDASHMLVDDLLKRSAFTETAAG